MRALLSIKPEFANKIFDGLKHFEYRKIVFKRPVTRVVVYASAPVCKVIGEFEVERVIVADLDKLWRDTAEHSGISHRYFAQYFSDRELGYAIKIKNAVRYEEAIPLSAIYQSPPPQSFAYL